MKELTHEDWIKNPTPRMMWVWDNEAHKKQMKVIYFSDKYMPYSVIAVDNNEASEYRYKHCAEIEKQKQRRMTHKELSRWLREKPTREFRYSSYRSVYSFHTYDEDYEEDAEVPEDILIREDDSEWREPLVEEK